MNSASAKRSMLAFKITGYALMACIAIGGYVIILYHILKNLEPYTGSMWAGIKVLQYMPLYFPLFFILATLLIGKAEKIMRPAFLWTAIVATIPLALTILWLQEMTFIGNIVVYNGQCTVTGAGTMGDGAFHRPYVALKCGDHAVNEWDSDVIVAAIRHPGMPLDCKLTATGNLSCSKLGE